MKTCYLCGNNEYKCRDGKVRDDENLDILECKNCGLVALSDFSHINKDFYQNTGMHKGTVDVAQWLDSTKDDDEQRFNDLRYKIQNKSVLDFGSGNGGFLMHAKNVSSNVAGIEVDKSIRSHYDGNDITLYHSVDDVKDKFDIITMFHVIEHLDEPHKMLKKLASKLNTGGRIIIETPNSDDALLKLYKSKAFSEFTYWSCHLYLFNESTLKSTIDKAELNTVKIYQKQRYPFSNHLYWLLKGKPGGHKKWDYVDKYFPFYESLLAFYKGCDTVMAEVKA